MSEQRKIGILHTNTSEIATVPRASLPGRLHVTNDTGRSLKYEMMTDGVDTFVTITEEPPPLEPECKPQPEGSHELNGRRGVVADRYPDLYYGDQFQTKRLDGSDPTCNGGFFLAENLRSVKDLGVVPSGSVITLPPNGTPVSWIELPAEPEPPADEPRVIHFKEFL